MWYQIGSESILSSAPRGNPPHTRYDKLAKLLYNYFISSFQHYSLIDSLVFLIYIYTYIYISIKYSHNRRERESLVFTQKKKRGRDLYMPHVR